MVRATTAVTTVALAALLAACAGGDGRGASDEDEAPTETAGSLECPTDEIESLIIDLAEDTPGTPGGPVEVVESWLDGRLEPTDELTPVPGAAALPGSSEGVAVHRDGRRIAVVSLLEAQDGGWLVVGAEGCAGVLTSP